MVQFRTQWIEKRLQSPFSFYSNETYDTERKHVEMENSTLGLDLAWEKRLLHELLNEMLSSHSPQIEEAIEIEEPTTETRLVSFMRFFTVILEIIKRIFTGNFNFSDLF